MTLQPGPSHRVAILDFDETYELQKMLLFGSLSLALVSARDHLIFFTAEVTRDGEVFDYKENAYDELSNSLKGFEIEATSTRQVKLPSPDWKLTIFQEIERSIADLGKYLLQYV